MKTILPVGSWIAWELEDTHKIVQYMGNGMYSHSVPPPLGTTVYMGQSIDEEFDFIFVPKTIHCYDGIASQKQWGFEYILTFVKNYPATKSDESDSSEKTE
jgi:hypothetical protein